MKLNLLDGRFAGLDLDARATLGVLGAACRRFVTAPIGCAVHLRVVRSR